MTASAFPKIEALKSVHIVGVCGTLMGNFAAYLKRSGVHVSGSDLNIYPPMSDVLKAAGVELFSGYSGDNLAALKQSARGLPDLIVIGNVIPASNPEAQAAFASGVPCTSLPEAMEKLLLPKTRNLVVSGTHGKTTTTAMLSTVLTELGQDPSYFFGGVAQDLPHSFHVAAANAGKPFVLEGDEYDTAYWDKVPKFNHYLPDDVMLTSVEYDHADIYPNMDALRLAFDGLVDRIRPGGRLIACRDFAEVMGVVERRVPSRKDLAVVTYASAKDKGADYWVENLRMVEDARLGAHVSCFEIGSREHGSLGELRLQVPGLHNAVNALAAWIEVAQNLGLEKKLSSERVRAAFLKFRGVKRRQEVRGEPRGITVIDDFAHHPTAVRETLRALALKYPGRRMLAVFEPRSATSRRKVFQSEYAAAFAGLKGLAASYIATPFDQSKIPSDQQFSTTQLIEDICGRGARAEEFPDVDAGVARVAKEAKAGDVVVVMSNGGFGGFITKLIAALG